jgi:hypothetical protein
VVLALQVLLLCSAFTLAIVSDEYPDGCSLQPTLDGLGSCDSDEGSDHGPQPDAVQTLGQQGIVTRYHDFAVDLHSLVLVEKDLATIRSRLPHEAIGLQVPQASDADRPGELTTDTHELQLHLDDHRGDAFDIDVTVALAPDNDVADQIEAVLPAESGTHWQALVPAADDFLADIPVEEATLTGGVGFLMYTLDFFGSDVCNGCTVKLTACWNEDLSLPGRSLLRGLGVRSGNGLTCFEPFPTTIVLMAPGRRPILRWHG